MYRILSLLFICSFAFGQSGIRSLNGSLKNSQRFVFDTTAAAFGFTISDGVHTINIPYRISNATSGGSVGNADSLGGLPASNYLLKSDSAKVASGYGASVTQSNHTATVSADSSVLMTKGTTQVVTAPKYFTARQYMTSLAVDTIVANSTGNKIYSTDSLSINGSVKILGNVAIGGYVPFSATSENILAVGRQDTFALVVNSPRGFPYSPSMGLFGYDTWKTNSQSVSNFIAVNNRYIGDSTYSSFMFGTADSATASNGVYHDAVKMSAQVWGKKTTASTITADWALNLRNVGTYREILRAFHSGGISVGYKSGTLSHDSMLTVEGGGSFTQGLLIGTSSTITNGFLDSDSIRDDGTTRATSGTWHSGIGAWSLGNITTGTINAGSSTITTTGAGSFGALSGTTGAFSSTVTASSTGFATHFRAFRNQVGIINGSMGIFDFQGVSGTSTQSTFSRISTFGIDTTATLFDGAFQIANAINGTLTTVATFKNDSALYLSTATNPTSGVGRMYAGSYYTGSTLTIDGSRNITAGTISSGAITSSAITSSGAYSGSITNDTYISPTTLATLTHLATTPASLTNDNSGVRIRLRSHDIDANINDFAYLTGYYIDPDRNSPDTKERRSGDLSFTNFYGHTLSRETFRLYGRYGNASFGGVKDTTSNVSIFNPSTSLLPKMLTLRNSRGQYVGDWDSSGAINASSGTFSGNITGRKGNLDSLSVTGAVTFSGISSDSTTVPSGGIYFRASDGILRRKY